MNKRGSKTLGEKRGSERNVVLSVLERESTLNFVDQHLAYLIS